MTTTPQDSTPLSVSVARAAAITSFSDFTIRDAINRGELPHIRRGRRIAIDIDDLRAWVKAQKVTDVA